MSLSILILIILFVFTAILAGLEMSFSSVNRIRVKARSENGDKKAKKILKYIDKYDETITTIIVLNNIINIIIPTVSTVIFLTIFVKRPEIGIVISTIFMTITLLVFGEIAPKIYGKKNSERFLYTFIGFVEIIVKLAKPITFIFIRINNFFSNKIFKTDDADLIEVEEEILTMIKESSQEGTLEENEGELLRNAIEFNDIRVDEILQPKNKVIMVDVDENPETVYEILVKEMYSRIPVYEGNTDNIIGIISEREFFREYIKNKNLNIRKILKDISFVPDTLKISKLLVNMQKEHAHISVVVDEYGTVQGIITFEDILEELVGEIYDEHDEVVAEYTKMGENYYQIIGDMTIQDFNELFDQKDIQTATEDSTIAGYILEIAERIPEKNDVIYDENFSYKIIETDSKKIELIEVKLKEK